MGGGDFMKSEKRLRAGLVSSLTARIWIVGAVCGFQYWLLTASMEAVHAGNYKIALPAAMACLACFVINLGLVVVGEKNLP